MSNANLPNIHDCPAIAFAQQNALVFSKRDSPDRFAGLSKLADKFSRWAVPELDSSVVATRDHEAVVKLQASDRIVVSTKTVKAFESGEGEDYDSAIRTTSDKD